MDFAVEGGGRITAERLLSDETGRLRQRWTLGASTSDVQRMLRSHIEVAGLAISGSDPEPEGQRASDTKHRVILQRANCPRDPIPTDRRHLVDHEL